MKKLIVILTLTILNLSCSTEEDDNRLGEPSPSATCTCVKIYEYTTTASNYTVWLPTGIITPSDYPCSQNNYTQLTGSYYNPSTGNTVQERFRVHCE